MNVEPDRVSETLAAFVIGQICHDLAGPIGAIINGTELLKDTRVDARDAVGLVCQTAENAAAILQFYRLACGSATIRAGGLEARIVEQIADDFLSTKRISVQLSSAVPVIPNEWVRVLLGTLYLAKGALPRGGQIRVNLKNSPVPRCKKQAISLLLTVEGERCVPVEDMLTQIAGSPPDFETMTPHDAFIRLVLLQYRYLRLDLAELMQKGRLHLELQSR